MTIRNPSAGGGGGATTALLLESGSSTKLTGLAAIAAVAAGDLLYVVDDATGTPISKGLDVDVLDTYLSATTKTLTNKTISVGTFTGDQTFDTDTLFVDAANGRVGIGTINPDSSLHVQDGWAHVLANSNSATAQSFRLRKSRNVTPGAHTIVQDGDDFGTIFFQGSDGAAFQSGASISAEVNGTPGVNDMPGRLIFSTTPDGSVAVVERMTVDMDGNVGIGTASPNQKLTVEGTMDLKEQAAANADTAAYGQIWVKNDTPNTLWFTDDAGTDTQLGAGGGGGGASEEFRAYGISQSINNFSVTKIQFSNEVFDTGNNFDPTTNYDYTAPSDGKYVFTLQATVQSMVDQKSVQIYIRVNDVAVRLRRIQASGTNAVGVNLTDIIDLSENDTVTFFIFQDSGATKTLTNDGTQGFVSGYKLV